MVHLLMQSHLLFFFFKTKSKSFQASHQHQDTEKRYGADREVAHSGRFLRESLHTTQSGGRGFLLSLIGRERRPMGRKTGVRNFAFDARLIAFIFPLCCLLALIQEMKILAVLIEHLNRSAGNTADRHSRRKKKIKNKNGNKTNQMGKWRG